MLVTVKFLGALGELMGAAALPVDLPAGGTYRALLDALGAGVKAKLPESAWDSAKQCFSRRMMVSLNGVATLSDPSTVLSDGDEILIVLPLAGG